MAIMVDNGKYEKIYELKDKLPTWHKHWRWQKKDIKVDKP